MRHRDLAGSRQEPSSIAPVHDDAGRHLQGTDQGAYDMVFLDSEPIGNGEFIAVRSL